MDLPGPYKVYTTDDGPVQKVSGTPSNIPQILQTPIRFQIVNLDPTIKKKEEFIGGGTNAAAPSSQPQGYQACPHGYGSGNTCPGGA